MPLPSSTTRSSTAQSTALPGKDVGEDVFYLKVQKSLRYSDGVFDLALKFTAQSGFTILFGPSGAGKTTLLDCIAGVQAPDQGKIAVGNKLYFSHTEKINVPPAKRRIGYVFQDLALFPHLTATENVEYGITGVPRRERHEKAQAILRTFRIERLSHRRPGDISGGERQRVALARALVIDPVLLLLDEPLAALDAATKSHIVDDLRSWNQEHGIPIFYVTHSREEVFALGERVLVMDRGHVVADGTPHAVLEAPRQETVAQLAGFENIFDATVAALREDRGTMTCRLVAAEGKLELETPLVRANAGTVLRVGIRAGDILIATSCPTGLSARNILQGTILSLSRRDVVVCVRVNCGVEMDVHLTLAARDALGLAEGKQVWLVIKTHSCHLMQA